MLALAIQLGTLQANDRSHFVVEKDVAQSKGSDYGNVVHVERGIPLKKAFEIAESNPDVDYFVYVKGYQMVLEVPSDAEFDPSNDPFGLISDIDFVYDSGEFGKGYCRVFKRGDVVFFNKNGMQLGTAPGLADAYFKVDNASQ